MKINVVGKTSPKQDTFSTLTPLNYALKIFGLSCVYRDGNRITYCSPVWRLIFFVIFFFLANIYGILVKLTSDKGQFHFYFKDAIEMAYLLGYFQFVIDAIFVYKYGRQPFVDYIQFYDTIDSILGIPYYEKIKKTIRNMCIFFIIVAVTCTTIDYFTWIDNSNLYYRLTTIGDSFENFYRNVNNLPDVTKDFIYDEVWICGGEFKKVGDGNMLKNISNDHFYVIPWLSRCYILLNEQCNFINAKYGFRILSASLIYLIDMVLMVNLVARLLMGTLVMGKGSRSLLILSTFVRIATYTFIMVCAIYRCEQSYRQMERIIRYIDHLLVAKNTTTATRDELRELKDLITSKPVKFHAINFFRIDYTALLSMFSVIVTYTIILLQSLQ